MGHIAALHAALQHVKREEREAEQALTKRDAAVAGVEAAYTGIADVAAGSWSWPGKGSWVSGEPRCAAGRGWICRRWRLHPWRRPRRERQIP